ncbi:MAG: enoyl-CoA hydratase [Dehalococcoidales bacterium]|nr:MAG: enoyl-CoA hydratase [Dehalococcoidales bacterium]
MEYERILYEKVEPEIVKITMNRPEKRNAQDPLMFSEMTDAFIEADLDEEVRVIIFAGAGKDFSAGHDMSGQGHPAKEGTVMRKALDTELTGMEMRLKREDYVFLNQGINIRNVSKPTIAMVQGNCLAGGWLNASMCDLIMASEDAKFGDPVVRMTPAGVEILFHPYDVGFRKAKEMLWTGDPITAQEAKELGLVSKVVPREKLEEETLALAKRIALSPPVAVSLVKRSINFAQDEMGQRNAWQYHMLIHQLSHASDETRRWGEERAKAMQQGGLKEMLKERDSKFAQ